MNAEEWLEKYGNVWPDEHSGTDAREFARRAECIIRALLAEKEAEEYLLRKQLEDWKKIAASRLADQEAIERHTRRVVAKDCAEIAEAMWSDHYWAWPAMQTYAAEIRKKYGVE